MRTISLLPYKMDNGQEYNVKLSLVVILFAPELKLNARDAIKHDVVAKKIEAATDEVLLEEAEWRMLKDGIEAHTGYSRHDIKLINLVLNAPEAKVRVDKEDPAEK